jgi:hypothetical protein
MDAGDGELEKAERALFAASEALADAERDIKQAEADIEAARRAEHRDRFKVEIIYDGAKKPFEVRRDELVKSLLDQAIGVFGPLPNPHTLSLFTATGRELPDSETIEAAGIKPDEILLLRPSKVKGGV